MRYLVQTARPIFEDLIGTLAFCLLDVLTGSVTLAAAAGLAIGVAQAILHNLKQEAVPGLLVIGIALTVTLGALSLRLTVPASCFSSQASATAVWGDHDAARVG